MALQMDTGFKDYQRRYFDTLATHRESQPDQVLSPFDLFFAHTYVSFLDDRVRDYIRNVGGGLVMDVGSGTGKYASVAASVGGKVHIVCADISFSSLHQAKRLKADIEERMSFVVCDAESLPFRQGVFDGVMAIMVLHHLPGFAALGEIHRVLIPGCEMLIAEMVSNNLVREFMKRAYSWMPKRVRASIQMPEDIVVSNDKMPVAWSFTSQRLLADIGQSGFELADTQFHSLFLFVFQYLAKILPFFRKLMTERVLRAAYRLESWLLQRSFFSRLACIVVCGCQKVGDIGG